MGTICNERNSGVALMVHQYISKGLVKLSLNTLLTFQFIHSVYNTYSYGIILKYSLKIP